MKTEQKRDTLYYGIRHNGQDLYDIGIKADGSLHNPNHYPDDTVRAAVERLTAVLDAKALKRRQAATEKRRHRRELRVYEIAKQIIAGQDLRNSHCHICGKGLGDPESIARGIGSECWQDILAAITRKREVDLDIAYAMSMFASCVEHG